VFKFFKKYITDFIAGVVASVSALIGVYVTLAPGTLENFSGSVTEILVALIAALIGGTLSAVNTKIQTKKSE